MNWSYREVVFLSRTSFSDREDLLNVIFIRSYYLGDSSTELSYCVYERIGERVIRPIVSWDSVASFV